MNDSYIVSVFFFVQFFFNFKIKIKIKLIQKTSYLLLCEPLFLRNHQSNVSWCKISLGLSQAHAESDSPRSDPVELVKLPWHGEQKSLQCKVGLKCVNNVSCGSDGE